MQLVVSKTPSDNTMLVTIKPRHAKELLSLLEKAQKNLRQMQDDLQPAENELQLLMKINDR